LILTFGDSKYSAREEKNLAEKLKLREYQTEALESLRGELRDGKKRLILYSPTGSGKTECAIALIKGAESKGKRTLFVCNRVQLVTQSSRRLHKAGLVHGVVQGANSFGSWNRILVCSIQTLASRGFPEDIDLIIVDEAHGAAGSSAYRELLFSAQVPVIGLTATPFSRGLGKHYDELGGPLFEDIVVAATIRELIDLGFLVDIEIYAPGEPNLDGVKITAGDYNEKELGERVDRSELIGDIVTHWKLLAGGKPTVCFATNIAHSQHIVDEFNKAGIRAEHIDCNSGDDERAEVLRRFENGTTTVVSNVSVLAEGWDMPACEVMILARPTRSLARYIQMAGRILRPADGKTRALMLDHSGSAKRLGFPTDDLPLILCDGKPQKKATREEEAKKEEALPQPCPNCHYMKAAKVFRCPRCGHEPRKPSTVATRAGELVKLARKNPTPDDKQNVYSQLFSIQKEKGYADGWTAHKYREYFGVWPKNMQDIAAPPTPEVKGFLTSRAIAYAKRKQPERTRGADV